MAATPKTLAAMEIQPAYGPAFQAILTTADSESAQLFISDRMRRKGSKLIGMNHCEQIAAKLVALIHVLSNSESTMSRMSSHINLTVNFGGLKRSHKTFCTISELSESVQCSISETVEFLTAIMDGHWLPESFC
ncbi:MAG: hypothetical protein J0L73_15960 [Verrucomicrobia bacterium]|nr:hypothetical protein [Verrucomicrobiota bacterium]